MLSEIGSGGVERESVGGVEHNREWGCGARERVGVLSKIGRVGVERYSEWGGGVERESKWGW